MTSFPGMLGEVNRLSALVFATRFGNVVADFSRKKTSGFTKDFEGTTSTWCDETLGCVMSVDFGELDSPGAVVAMFGSDGDRFEILARTSSRFGKIAADFLAVKTSG